MEEKETRTPSPNIILRCDNDFLNSQKSAWDSSSDGEEVAEKRKVPDVHKDDLASRRVHPGPIVPKVHQFVPPPVCTSKDRERWEGIRRASQQTQQEKEISEKEADPDIITRRDNPFLKEEEDEGEEGRVKAVPNKQRDDLALRRAQSKPLPHKGGPMSFVSSSMSQADMQKWERLKITEPSHVDADPNQTAPAFADPQPWTTLSTPTAAELDAQLAQYEERIECADEEEEELIPDLQKDDMMARRTGVFHKQSAATVNYNRFLPLPGSKRYTQDEFCTDAAPCNKKKVQTSRAKKQSTRVDHLQPSDSTETPQQRVEPTVVRATSYIEAVLLPWQQNNRPRPPKPQPAPYVPG
ncbi:uncharacterized protein LOC121638166 [Melanotaenia boesemani]|uniref:uncharacterized protein LOC121638166 n=1 Tax=Melanotaenia boesemani TaxID=1250792 RepID=UPI001C05096C|nr:uncharacterized protein LOC121638166 [Melanotaenia boesemani]